MFNLPRKEIIVNDDSQIVLKGTHDITANPTTWVTPILTGTNILTTGNEAFQIEGFLSPVKTSQLVLLASATRIRSKAFTAATFGNAAFVVTLNGTGPQQDDVVMLRMDAQDLTPTEFQNKGFEKRYQFSAAKTTVATVISHLVTTINGDKYAPVVAWAGRNNTTPAQDDSAKIVLIPKKAGRPVTDFIPDSQSTVNNVVLTRSADGTTVYYSTVDGTNVVTGQGATSINDYDYLKNINWAKNFSIDQNINWMPLPGATYTSYYFEINGIIQDQVGGIDLVSETRSAQKTAYTIYAKTGSAFVTAMDFFVIDMNV